MWVGVSMTAVEVDAVVAQSESEDGEGPVLGSSSQQRGAVAEVTPASVATSAGSPGRIVTVDHGTRAANNSDVSNVSVAC